MRFKLLGFPEQGLTLTARILSRAGLISDLHAQDFTESTAAYVRLAKEEILEKGPTEKPDFILFLDQALFPPIRELKDSYTLLINAPEKPVSPLLKERKIAAHNLDATAIAQSHLAQPLPGTAMLGGLLRYYPKISMKSLKAAIEAECLTKVKENCLAAEEGFRAVK